MTSMSASRISLSAPPSFRAAHKYQDLTEQQEEYITAHKTVSLAWRALFGSDIDEQDSALRGLIRYVRKAVHRPYLPDGFIEDRITEVLTPFFSLTEQEAFTLEKNSRALEYIVNRVESRAINFYRHVENTVAGKAERGTKSLSILDSDSDETQARLEAATDVVLATGVTAVKSPSERIQEFVAKITTNRARLISEIGIGGAETYRCAVAIANDRAVQWSVEFGNKRQTESSATQAIEKVFRCSTRTAQSKKKLMFKRITEAIARGSFMWSQILNGLKAHDSDRVVSETHHIARGRKAVKVQMFVGPKSSKQGER